MTLTKAGKVAALMLQGRTEEALSDAYNPGMKAARAEMDPVVRQAREAAVRGRLDQPFSHQQSKREMVGNFWRGYRGAPCHR